MEIINRLLRISIHNYFVAFVCSYFFLGGVLNYVDGIYEEGFLRLIAGNLCAFILALINLVDELIETNNKAVLLLREKIEKETA